MICETAEAKRVYVVPGVPAEMREMMQGTILPELKALAGDAALVSRIIKVTGVAEAKVAETLDDLFRSATNPTLAYLASSGEVKVRITAKAASVADAETLIAPVAAEVGRRLGDRVFATTDEDLAVVVGGLLAAQGRTVAVAESLTGGALAARISAAAGASAYFAGGAVCYTAESKRAVLGVSEETLNGPGVVSEECAREMAQGVRRLFAADVGLGLTGVAGPEPHGGKPVGTVCVSVAGDDPAETRTFVAPGDREQIRRWAEQGALDLARLLLLGRRGGTVGPTATVSSA